MQQHRKSCRALHQSADGGAVQAQDEVSFPMARHAAVFDLCWTLADEELRGDERFATPARGLAAPATLALFSDVPSVRASTRPAHGHRAPGRWLVADAHAVVARKVQPQASGNLLWAPCHSPSAALPSPAPPTFPWQHRRDGHRGTARSGHGADQPLLHISPQRRVGGQLCRFRATPRPLRVPLRGSPGCRLSPPHLRTPR